MRLHLCIRLSNDLRYTTVNFFFTATVECCREKYLRSHLLICYQTESMVLGDKANQTAN